MAKRTRGKEIATYMPEATGASDATSGGGAGSGIPDAETVAYAGNRVTRGNVRRDREKLFPERFGKKRGKKSAKAATTKGRGRAGAKTRARKSSRRAG